MAGKPQAAILVGILFACGAVGAVHWQQKRDRAVCPASLAPPRFVFNPHVKWCSDTI